MIHLNLGLQDAVAAAAGTAGVAAGSERCEGTEAQYCLIGEYNTKISIPPNTTPRSVFQWAKKMGEEPVYDDSLL